MSDQDKQILALLLESEDKLSKASAIFDPDTEMTPESSTEIRDFMIASQDALNKAFPLLKARRQVIFALKPKTQLG